MNQIETQWVRPPKVSNVSGTASRSDAGAGMVCARPHQLLDAKSLITEPELKTLRAAERHLDALTEKLTFHCPMQVRERIRKRRTALMEGKTADVLKGDLTTSMNIDGEVAKNGQAEKIVRAHIERVEDSVRGILCDILERAAKTIGAEIGDYEQELTARAARYGLKPSTTDSLEALRHLKSRLDSFSQRRQPGSGSMGRPSGCLRDFMDVGDLC